MEFSDADIVDDEIEEGSQGSEDGRGHLNDEENKESIDHEGQQYKATPFESIFGNHNRHSEYHEVLGSEQCGESL